MDDTQQTKTGHKSSPWAFGLGELTKQEAHGPQFTHLHICKCHATVFQYCKFDHTIKGHSSLIILTNLVDLESPMLYTKNQPQSFLSTGEEDF